MVNIFTTIVIAIASGGLGYLFGWLVTRSTTESSKPKDRLDQDWQDILNFDFGEKKHRRYPTRITVTEDLE